MLLEARPEESHTSVPGSASKGASPVEPLSDGRGGISPANGTSLSFPPFKCGHFELWDGDVRGDIARSAGITGGSCDAASLSRSARSITAAISVSSESMASLIGVINTEYHRESTR